ncbi:restriction endonuclease [Sphingobacterium faecium]|uniref:restriction endonuclease n=1 Tax=Sphingobacterium faecium TaxID=34087 RepID=UPI003DA6C775
MGYGPKNKVTGESGVKHQIDVLTEQFNEDKRLLTAIECKYIKQKVNKDIIMKLSEIMQDAAIDQGIIVCKSGFTLDTVTYAEHKGIKLVKLWEAGENDLDYKKEIEIGTINIQSTVIRSRPNITSIDFGNKTIHFDPSIGVVYTWKLYDTSGNEYPLKPLMFAFGDKLKSQGIPLKNTTVDYTINGNLFLKIGNEQIAIKKISITGFLTINDLKYG